MDGLVVTYWNQPVANGADPGVAEQQPYDWFSEREDEPATAREAKIILVSAGFGTEISTTKQRAICELVVALSAAGVAPHDRNDALPNAEFFAVDEELEDDSIDAFVKGYPKAKMNLRVPCVGSQLGPLV
jgi:hypothetical protein